jgi:uncharacterized damage-inducible protein DinB
MSSEELALKAPSSDASSSTSWPIWAIAAHTAATRVYWLCHVAGERGADATPFADPSGFGWEDELDHPRSAEELVGAWTTTWAVVERAITGWTPAMLAEPISRREGGTIVHYTRRSLLMRMITHEAYHVGEIALIQGIGGRAQLDLWPAGHHSVEAEAARASD